MFCQLRFMISEKATEKLKCFFFSLNMAASIWLRLLCASLNSSQPPSLPPAWQYLRLCQSPGRNTVPNHGDPSLCFCSGQPPDAVYVVTVVAVWTQRWQPWWCREPELISCNDQKGLRLGCVCRRCRCVPPQHCSSSRFPLLQANLWYPVLCISPTLTWLSSSLCPQSCSDELH